MYNKEVGQIVVEDVITEGSLVFPLSGTFDTVLHAQQGNREPHESRAWTPFQKLSHECLRKWLWKRAVRGGMTVHKSRLTEIPYRRGYLCFFIVEIDFYITEILWEMLSMF